MTGQKMPPSGLIVSTSQGVTVLGGGHVQPGDLRAALALAPVLVAADGGADMALGAGLEPVAVIGDLDSVSADALARLDPRKVHEVPEQDSTDFDKALRHIDAPLIVAAGFNGGRLDHELAAMHTLIARPGRRCILLGGQDIVFHAPPEMTLDLEPGTRVSLFPMAEVTGRSVGLRWAIDGLVFHPARRVGTSNAATGGPMTLRTDGPGMLTILPRALLPEAAAALRTAEVHPAGV